MDPSWELEYLSFCFKGFSARLNHYRPANHQITYPPIEEVFGPMLLEVNMLFALYMHCRIV